MSTIVDVATDAVIGELCRLGTPYVRINTEDFPFNGSVDYQPNDVSRPIFGNLTQGVVPRSIWYRRLRVPARPADMDAGLYDFCLRENRSALIGGLLGQPTRWMSLPDAIWKADYKPYQLHLAAKLGS